jgi:hypothetical protein
MKRSFSLLALVFCLFLSSCHHEDGLLDLDDLYKKPSNFVDHPILLKVKNFGVINSFSVMDQQKARLFPASLVPELSKWASEKFIPEGSEGSILFRIIDARVSEMGLDIFSNSHVEEKRSLGVNIIVNLQIEEKHYNHKHIQIRISEEIPLTKEDLGSEKRKEIWTRLVGEIISDLSQRIEAKIRGGYPRLISHHSSQKVIRCG